MAEHEGWVALASFAAGAVGSMGALLTARWSVREKRGMIRDTADEARHPAAQLPRAAREACERAAEAAHDAFAERLHP
jgi:hypothetical protein